MHKMFTLLALEVRLYYLRLTLLTVVADHYGVNIGVFGIRTSKAGWDFLWEVLWTGW